MICSKCKKNELSEDDVLDMCEKCVSEYVGGLHEYKYKFKGEKKMNKYYEIAKVCFELVVKLRELNNEKEVDLNETFDTISPERQKYLYDNIEHIINNPQLTAKDEHDVWMEPRINDGWVYGPETDRENKIHNCLVPFEDLNFYQKLKDHLVIETVKMYFGL